VAKVELDVPALAVKRLQVRLGCLLRAQECGHENLAAGGELPHSLGLGHHGILGIGHPVRLELGVAQFDQVIARAQTLTATKVGGTPARSLLLEHRLDAALAQGAEQEIACEIGIAEQQVAAGQGIEQGPQQCLLVTALAPVAPDGRVEYRTAAQTDQPHQPAQWKTETGFLAGFIAAVVTPEWRVGVISTSNNPAGIAARNGFLNGVIYFCGLCRQTYPPYEDYPLYVELPAGSSPAEWQATADTLRDRLVKTVYVAPGAGDQALLTYIAEADINIIGSSQPPEAIRDHWVASIQPDYLQALQQVWPELVNGTGAAELPTTIEIDAVNASLFSPGRQMLVDEFLNDLQNGYIDTGVDPVTGEVR